MIRELGATFNIMVSYFMGIVAVVVTIGLVAFYLDLRKKLKQLFRSSNLMQAIASGNSIERKVLPET